MFAAFERKQTEENIRTLLNYRYTNPKKSVKRIVKRMPVVYKLKKLFGKLELQSLHPGTKFPAKIFSNWHTQENSEMYLMLQWNLFLQVISDI